jgi:H+-translocating NAD(P) transhydrogenase subunit alpha
MNDKTVLAVIRETSCGEKRVAMTPDVARKFAALGVGVRMEAGAGCDSFFPDAAYSGVEFAPGPAVTCAQAAAVLRVMPPTVEEVELIPEGATLIGLLKPYTHREQLAAMNRRRITAFAMELLPRISRAQSMDVLSSQASVAGYQAALIAATHCPKFFPMLTTAAGTIRPARVLVIGAGVAGLQAIATCKRLGAIVEAYDVRAAAREHVESLGARFVATGVSAEGAGGYARELTEEERRQQQERLAAVVSAVDVVISTASIPGRKAPLILPEAMVRRMKVGSVVVDAAAETGGNCDLTRPGETCIVGGVTVVGPLHLPGRSPTHASEMYAANLYHFLSPHLKDGRLNLDWNDEIVAGALLCRDGRTVHAGVLKEHGGK